MLTLWDLMKPVLKAVTPTRAGQRPARPIPPRAPQAAPAQAKTAPGRAAGRKPALRVDGSASAAGQRRRETKPRDSMDAKYARVTKQMLDAYGVRVRRWRTAMSGIAWYVTYRDGSVVRLIEAPKPKGPMSAAVFLHEIGHHAIGFDVYKPRCLEEYHAWKFALDKMRELGLNVTPAVERRMQRSLKYAVAKAKRRGLKMVPAELEPFCN